MIPILVAVAVLISVGLCAALKISSRESKREE